MKARYRIFVLLCVVTVALGAVIFMRSSDDSDAVLRFRAFFSYHSLYTLKSALPSLSQGTGLWYAGLSVFAILMVGLVLKAARRNGSQGLRERLIELKPAKVAPARLRGGEIAPASMEDDSGLRRELKSMRELVEAKDSMITELEKNLSGKQQLLQTRSQELESLKAKGNALMEQLADLRLAKERAENLFHRELEKIKVLQAKEGVIAELENSLAATRELLQDRSQEFEALRTKVNDLTEQLTDLRLAKERAEALLERELEKIKALQAKESSTLGQEDALSGQVEVLQNELSEKQELLRNRNKELKAARSKVKALRERLNTLASTKDQAANVLQQQLRQKTELLQSKDAAIKELEESFNTRVRALEEQLEEKGKLLKDRDAELANCEFEGNSATGPSLEREPVKGLVLQELQHRAELLQAKESLVKELQERLDTTVQALESARDEVKRLVQERDAELTDPSTEVKRKGMNAKLLELGAAKAQAKTFLHGEEAERARERMDSTLQEPGESRVRDQTAEMDGGRSEGLTTEPEIKERR
jgi:myosin heavy subunit